VKVPAVLAVDGGGSKVDAAFLRRDGNVLGTARAPTGGGDGLPGTDGHMRQVMAAVRAAAVASGIVPDTRPLAELGVWCLAGADLPGDDRRIDRWLRRQGITNEDLVRNDSFAVLRAGSERGWGVGIVCGSGTNCSGVAPDGRITRFPAIGSISGDWGGASDLGPMALWYAIRDEDGRGDRTSLRRLVPAHFRMTKPRQVMEALYLGGLDERRLLELTPVVFRAAADRDAVARALVDRQADEIVAMATVAIKRLRMRRLDVDVVLGGGVFRNEWPPFFDRIRDGIREVAAGVELRVLATPPVVGAALLGLDRLGASRAAQTRVRFGLTHDRFAPHTRARRKES
jgi:N-acetylglucosamine kinase-like BadF-type ATPase